MQGSHGSRWRCEQRSARARRQVDAYPAAPLVLAPFSTGLPPDILGRLRQAAARLGLRQGEITAATLERFLREHGC